MAYSTSFDGAEDTVVGTEQGWTLTGYSANNFARLDGAGGLKILPNGGLNSTIHERVEAADCFVEVVLGANFQYVERLVSLRGGISVGWYAAGGYFRIQDVGSTMVLLNGVTGVAGDTVRLEAQGDQLRLYINSVLRHTRTYATRVTNTIVGFKANTGATGYSDTIRSWASGLLAPADTVPPEITALGLTATSPTTLTGEFTSNEAGLVSAVLYPAIQMEPSDAQVLLGYNTDGVPADSFINGQAMTVGVNTLLFTGADAETAYKFKVVARDSVPNVAAGVALTGSETTPLLPKNASITLYAENGSTPKASVTGLQWAWWDSATPNFSLAPSVSGTGASTNGSGVFSVSLTGSGLVPGQTGTLLIYKTDGTAESTATLAFCAPVVMVS